MTMTIVSTRKIQTKVRPTPDFVPIQNVRSL